MTFYGNKMESNGIKLECERGIVWVSAHVNKTIIKGKTNQMALARQMMGGSGTCMN
jgi:hypothetical protein